MKFQIATTFLAAASVNALALGNVARDVELLSDTKIAISGDVMNSAAFKPFQNTRVLVKTPTTAKRQDVVTPDNIFVLQCVDAGFREPCLVFGAPPGSCVSYFDFQGPNSTEVSDVYWKKVTSLATNTGGNCMFFQNDNCNALGDDRGLTAKYIYDMSVALPEDPRIPEYNNNITSWRC
ncbi:hypothetical protein N0V93_004075 [Gnomoniopsis smithogilvyi]|uniref:Uncharacterized protein n=1 Tax=Gnomoniopsis smithogilvyi TaxID=1191159 RepID=A0A9W9CZ93_9PEZI|nr:hypothetical protein N0V93_004075 [Gnomoniopsis smithogilvyi]